MKITHPMSCVKYILNSSFFRSHRVILLTILKCRALIVFQTSPRLNNNEGSPFQQRALAHLVESKK